MAVEAPEELNKKLNKLEDEYSDSLMGNENARPKGEIISDIIFFKTTGKLAEEINNGGLSPFKISIT